MSLRLLNIYYIRYICNFDWSWICVFVFVYFYMYFCICTSYSGTLRSSYHYLIKNIAHVMSICNFDQCCIYVFGTCVFVSVYLQVRHQGTLFPRPSYHYLFKNIAHVMSIGNFDQCCICVFVYLYLCIWKSDTQEHCFWGHLTFTFSKI